MSNLTNPQDSLKLLHSLLSKSTDTLTQGQKNTSSTEKSAVSAHTDSTLTPAAITDTVSALSVHALTPINPVQDGKNTTSVSASVHFGDGLMHRWREKLLSLSSGVPYPVLIELCVPEPEAKKLTRLCLNLAELEQTLADWEHCQPTAAWLLAPQTQEPLVGIGSRTTRYTPPDEPAEECPMHWSRVPELPQYGDIPPVDSEGRGRLYRVLAGGKWWLVEYLPPFDGPVSLTDTTGKVRVFMSVEEALLVVEVLGL